MQPHTSREIAEAMMYHQDRRTSIYNSLYAAVLGLVPHPADNHPGYKDFIVTRECDRAPLSDAHLAWLDHLMAQVQS